MSGMLTCIACRLTFPSADSQRDHYRTDFHRFNLKRKVADLPPVTQEYFDAKVQLLKHDQTTKQVFNGYCGFCKKKFSNERTYDVHVKSRKHLEMQAKHEEDQKKKKTSETDGKVKLVGTTTTQPRSLEESVPLPSRVVGGATAAVESAAAAALAASPPEEVARDVPKTEEELIAEKIANARHFEPEDCLFCVHRSASFDKNISHMTKAHGFFIPDVEFLYDIKGFVHYLGQKIGTGNVCLFCDKMFRTAEAVMAHMVSLGHCKLRYDDDTDEYEDFYDFSASWDGVGKDGEEQDPATNSDRQLILAAEKGVVDVVDDGYGLKLANGKVLGHRDLLYVYRQRYRPPLEKDSASISRVINKYKAIGWSTQVTQGQAKLRSRFLRRDKKEKMRLGVKANKLQPHFRRQTCF